MHIFYTFYKVVSEVEIWLKFFRRIGLDQDIFEKLKILSKFIMYPKFLENESLDLKNIIENFAKAFSLNLESIYEFLSIMHYKKKPEVFIPIIKNFFAERP